MKYPKEVNAYCPYCKTHTKHKVKLLKKGKRRTLAIGERKHARKLKGHGGKVAGIKSVKKQGKRQTIILTCSQCNKKHQRTIGTRTKKKLELTA